MTYSGTLSSTAYFWNPSAKSLSAESLSFQIAELIKNIEFKLAYHGRDGVWDLVDIETEREVVEESSYAGSLRRVHSTRITVTVPFVQRQEPETSTAPGSDRDTSATSSE